MPTSCADVTIVLEGSPEPQRYAEQMDDLMPHVIRYSKAGDPPLPAEQEFDCWCPLCKPRIM